MNEQHPDRAAHERAQLARWSQLTHAQRLAWLWEAKMFARRAMEAARIRVLGDAARAAAGPAGPALADGDNDATSVPG